MVIVPAARAVSYGVKIASDDLTFTCKNSLNFFLIKDIYLPILSKIDRDKKVMNGYHKLKLKLS